MTIKQSQIWQETFPYISYITEKWTAGRRMCLLLLTILSDGIIDKKSKKKMQRVIGF